MAEKLERDPVCKMEVRKEKAVSAECEGVTLYFCSEGCRNKFFRDRSCPRTAYDLIIIGGGPAGLTAAVYAATLRVDALLITKELGGQAIDSTKIENYMGFDFITGPELIHKFEHQLFHSHYIDHVLGEAEKIEPAAGGFAVTTSELKSYRAGALLVATGMTRRRLGVPGEDRFQRKGIFYGHVQDLSFVEGQEVAVIGGGNSALQVVENLRTIASSIHLVAPAGLTADPEIVERVSAMENLHRYEGFKVTEFGGEEALSQVTLRRLATDESLTIAVRGAFVAIGFSPNSGLLAGLVELDEHGQIAIERDCSTSRAGIFAAGDVTDSFGKRIIIASGEGAKAAMAIRQYLLNLRKRGA